LGNVKASDYLPQFSAKEIHAPWEKGLKVKGYPDYPIIDGIRTEHYKHTARRMKE
jgi:hypothetical protein